MRWWCADDALMMRWWCADDALTMHWRYTDDTCMVHWILFSKIYHMLGLSGTSSYAVFVYLCFCICVFVCSAHGNIIFDILEQSSFQKYTTCCVFLALRHMLYLCIRAQWEYQFLNFISGCMYSYGKSNFKADLFSSTFWFERIFISKIGLLVFRLFTF